MYCLHPRGRSGVLLGPSVFLRTLFSCAYGQLFENVVMLCNTPRHPHCIAPYPPPSYGCINYSMCSYDFLRDNLILIKHAVSGMFPLKICVPHVLVSWRRRSVSRGPPELEPLRRTDGGQKCGGSLLAGHMAGADTKREPLKGDH